jgi:hypothetical protein
MRGDGGDAYPQRTDLRAGRSIELNGAALIERARIPVGPERERIVPVRGQGNGVGRNLRPRVVADCYRNVYLPRRYRIVGRCEAQTQNAIWPAAGVSNSTVPRLSAVTGNPSAGSDKTKEV